ncbi:DUF2712 domain-containing protein [Paraliobacillus ryukyuensis]|uniref:DUF2712 domain-containing protein n=1 Tax=Paraliobacillus ryukyuensis TaxID=200904 RepID=UPI0009A627DC|nr:DUF2712 domain-containing protein [Paraliobacillus ryukyuensis]
MKRFSKIKRLATVCLIGATLLGVAGGTVSAEKNKFSYSFNIKANYGNDYSKEYYRQTTNLNNRWMVDLQSSTEGDGTYTTFWLDKSGTRVSEPHDVKQGSGRHLYKAYSTANKKYVRLGGENNNYSSNTYTATGKWDEEGW